MPSIFTRIINNEIPAYKIAEDENYLAFLDVNPLVKGHTLVIPKKEIDYLFDLNNEEYLGLMSFAKMVAAGIKNAVPCLRIGVAVIGLEVPHAHVHLVPLNSMSDINFSNPKQEFSKDVMMATAKKIADAIRN